MIAQQKLGIILNPAAGRGRAEGIKKRLISCLQKKKIQFQLELTKGPEHAKEIAMRMGDAYKIIIAAGGDGTVNEVASGIVGKKTAIAILPIGSGNDFSKVLGISNNMDNAIDSIFNKKKKLLDIGKVTYWNKFGDRNCRYFVNTLGMGLDAEIARETKKIKYLRGLPLYLLAAFKAINKHTPNEYTVIERKKKRVERAFLICAGNGCFEGGGFKLLSDADPSDSMLDICILKAMPVYKAIGILPKLIQGTHRSLNEVLMWKSGKIIVEAKNAYTIHGDGEIFEENAIRAEIEIAQDRICFVLPKEKNV